MSQLRHKFSLVLDGKQYMITTSARDMAAAQIEGEANAVDQTWRLMHAACIRLEIPGTPSDWESFADLLDDFDDLELGLKDKDKEMDPTRETVSGG